MRELLIAIFTGTPVIGLVESEESHGGRSEQEVLDHLREADLKYRHKWGDANLCEEVKGWLLRSSAERKCGECVDAEPGLMRNAASTSTAALQAAWQTCPCSPCRSWRRKVRGREICEALVAGVPIGDQLHGYLFNDDPLRWNRLPAFQLVTLRLLAQMVLHQPLIAPDEVRAKKLAQPKAPAESHVYCSPHNRGALEMLMEMTMIHGIPFQVKPSSADAGNSMDLKAIEQDVKRRVAGAVVLKSRTPLLITTDVADLPRCEHALVYLTEKTWQSGDTSTSFASHVAAAMDEGTSLLLVHEMPGVKGDVRHACEFNVFFACDRGTTPPALMERGIYGKIAIPLQGGEWRVPSMAILLNTIAGADAQRLPVMSWARRVGLGFFRPKTVEAEDALVVVEPSQGTSVDVGQGGSSSSSSTAGATASFSLGSVEATSSVIEVHVDGAGAAGSSSSEPDTPEVLA